MPITSFTGRPGFNYQYNVPSFQEYMGTTPTNLLDLLQGYKTQQLAQQISGQKELAGMGYQSAADLQRGQLASARELAGMGYKSAADLQREQLAAQRALQMQAAQEEANRMNLLSELDWRKQAQANLMSGLDNELRAMQQRRRESEMWSAPYYTISTPANRRAVGYTTTRLLPTLAGRR